MTREAKIGMLTGLGVIVLIGVLLSNYLGDPHALMAGSAPAAGSSAVESNATGQMAPLPVGVAYRREMLSPAAGAVEAPDMNPGAAAGSEMHWAMAQGSSLPAAVAAGTDVFPAGRTAGQSGPVIQNPVSPIAAEIPADQRMSGGPDSGPPVIMVADAARVAPGSGVAAPGAVAAPAGANANYTIAKGDTLNKIAHKFYHSGQDSDLQRIVAANPGSLKDVHSLLIQGRTLVIPGAAVAAPVRAAQAVAGGVPLPGDAGTNRANSGAAATATQTPAKKPSASVYVVEAGDTLNKIAHKLSPGKSTAMEQKLISLNGIKDPDDLPTGTKLKLPA